MVCIDNKNIRDKILNSKTLKIKTVPCVILTYEDGHFEKFEDDSVGDWVLEQIVNNSQQPNTQIEEEFQEQPPVQEEPQPVQEEPQLQPVERPRTVSEQKKSAIQIAAELSSGRENEAIPENPYQKGTMIQQQMKEQAELKKSDDTYNSTVEMAAQMQMGRDDVSIPNMNMETSSIAKQMQMGRDSMEMPVNREKQRMGDEMIQQSMQGGSGQTDISFL